MAIYTLYASIPAQVEEIEEISRAANGIAAKHGGKFQGSGFGFGNRDIDWGFNDAKRATAAKGDLQTAFPLARISIELEPNPEK